MSLKKQLRRLEQRLFPGRVHARHRRQWELRWSRHDFDAPWLDRGVSKEIIEAVDSGFFPAGADALDIGCGTGEVSAWLAMRGYSVLGIDFSAAAIALARERRGESAGRLEFRLLDIVTGAPTDRTFAVLLDRGCFHSVIAAQRAAYARHLASVAAPGAHFLLFIAAFRGWTGLPHREEREFHDRIIDDTFASSFDIVRSAETTLFRDGARESLASDGGLVYWMIRR